MEHTIDNVNLIITNINRNTEIIKELLLKLRNNCISINNKLSECAAKHILLTNEQILTYHKYLNEYDHIKEHIEKEELTYEHNPVKLLSDITSLISFFNGLVTLHSNQLAIIDRLCKLLDKSDDVIKIIA